jgi:hypothetical protein
MFAAFFQSIMTKQNDVLETKVRQIILDLVVTLGKHGIKTVPVGALMRMLGVPNDVAADHDDEVVEVTADLLNIFDVGELEITTIQPPPGTQYH